MRIVSYNIQFGRGMDRAIDLVRCANAVRGGDIICLQEVDQGWKRSGLVDQAAEIAGLLPTYFYVYGGYFDVDASVHTAHGAVVNRRRRHGNLVLSRWPILSARVFPLPKHHYAERFNMHMGFVETVIDTGAMALRVYNCHFGYLESSERVCQAEAFARAFLAAPAEQGAWCGKNDINGDDWADGRETPPMPASAVVCGDLNAGPGSPEYRRLLELTGLVDCWAAAGSDEIDAPTWKFDAHGDTQSCGKIDHILVSSDLAGSIRAVEIDHVCDASDHKPIAAEIDPG